LAATAALTATIALLTGFPPASADELADLRANQELLQRRIDQLAQLPQQKVAPGVAGPMGTEAIPGQAIIGGELPAVIPDTGHRHLDPDRRLRRPYWALLSARRQHTDTRHDVVELRAKR